MSHLDRISYTFLTEDERKRAGIPLDDEGRKLVTDRVADAIKRRTDRLKDDNLTHEQSIAQACGFAPRSAIQIINNIQSELDILKDLLKKEVTR